MRHGHCRSSRYFVSRDNLTGNAVLATKRTGVFILVRVVYRAFVHPALVVGALGCRERFFLQEQLLAQVEEPVEQFLRRG